MSSSNSASFSLPSFPSSVPSFLPSFFSPPLIYNRHLSAYFVLLALDTSGNKIYMDLFFLEFTFLVVNTLGCVIFTIYLTY